MKAFIATIAVAMVVASCGGTRAVEITEADSGMHVDVRTGDMIELSLASNPSTGYSWVLADAPLNCLLLGSERYIESESGLVGAPGIQEFVFEAVDEGAEILRLEYLRRWEQTPIPERVVEFIVSVDGAVWPPRNPGPPPSTTIVTAPPQ